jgi:hypothetical protein
MGLKEYMGEKREVTRWIVMRVALTGAFAGALLMLIFSLLGMLKV